MIEFHYFIQKYIGSMKFNYSQVITSLTGDVTFFHSSRIPRRTGSVSSLFGKIPQTYMSVMKQRWSRTVKAAKTPVAQIYYSVGMSSIFHPKRNTGKKKKKIKYTKEKH